MSDSIMILQIQTHDDNMMVLSKHGGVIQIIAVQDMGLIEVNFHLEQDQNL